MAQEQFAGPEYFTEFDPEKFIRDMKQVNEMDEEAAESSDSAEKTNDADS
ncbi:MULTISPECIES: hypothetical protein [Corynebacterium]|nr:MULTISPECIES: hypothetical protein [Corynebacterium]KXB55243.1 hypothetical protein HMPREF0307_01087 [Corynebacterium sp. DNF00584]MBF9010801.1 hypothetical protein [Corynebacterium phoceense]